MKMGILSINAYTTVLNFASPLHSYAFQAFLDEHGLDNVIVDYRPSWWNEFFRQRVYDPYTFYLEHPLEDPDEQDAVLKKWDKLKEARKERARKIETFARTHFRRTDISYDRDMLRDQDPGCDIYACVTDVIWKYEPLYGFDPVFFLDMPVFEGKGKIAYAASKGPSVYTPEQEEEFFRMIRPFHYIGCRERALYELAAGKREAALVLDPVFLHEASFYDRLCKGPGKRKPYVLVYTVMQRSRSLIRKASQFAAERGLDLVDVSDDVNILYGRKRYPRENRYDAGVEEWLGYIRDAEYVFTNSFHACCLSIIFQKEFYTGIRSGDKIRSLLELFGLEGRDISDLEQPPREKISWRKVDALRRKYKKASEAFILGAVRETAAQLQGKAADAKVLSGIEDMAPGGRGHEPGKGPAGWLGRLWPGRKDRTGE